MVNPGILCVGQYPAHPMSPMGLLRIGAYFKQHGHNVKLIDGALVPNFYLVKSPINKVYPNAPFVDYRPCGSEKLYEREGMMKPIRYYGKPLDLIKREMLSAFNGKPDQIWVGTHLTYYYETSWELVSLSKALFPNVPVLVGGIYPSLCYEHASRCGADIVYKGEISNLESYLPDYSLMSYEHKVKMFKAGRGCLVNPQCAFCSVITLEPIFRGMDVDPTVDWIVKEFNSGTKDFVLWSSQLLVPPKTFKEFCRRIIATGLPSKGLRLAASEGIQPSIFTEEIALLMKQAGFDDINIPLEAIRDERVDEYQKPSSFTHVERSIDYAFKYGFRCIKAFIMMATPNQTPDEIIEAIVYCWKRHVRISLMPFTPVPGSKMFEDSEEFRNRPLELLNPFLWPAAHEGLTCRQLEEISSIAHLGFDVWFLKRKKTFIHSLFEKYAIKYNLLYDRSYFLRPLNESCTKTNQ